MPCAFARPKAASAGAFANEQRAGLSRALEDGHTTFADELKERTGMDAGRLQHLFKELALAGLLRETTAS